MDNDSPVKQIWPDLKLLSFDAQIMSQKKSKNATMYTQLNTASTPIYLSSKDVSKAVDFFLHNTTKDNNVFDVLVICH